MTTATPTVRLCEGCHTATAPAEVGHQPIKVSPRDAITKAVPVHLKVALSVREVALLTGTSEWTVRRLLDQGVLPRVPYTERTLIARIAVERWVRGEVTP